MQSAEAMGLPSLLNLQPGGSAERFRLSQERSTRPAVHLAQSPVEVKPGPAVLPDQLSDGPQVLEPLGSPFGCPLAPRRPSHNEAGIGRLTSLQPRGTGSPECSQKRPTGPGPVQRSYFELLAGHFPETPGRCPGQSPMVRPSRRTNPCQHRSDLLSDPTPDLFFSTPAN
jgi:hypothetical protein